MKLVDLTLSRRIPGPPEEVFDVWFDPRSPGGPWHGAKKVLMTLAVDGIFYFGVERAIWQEHTGIAPLHGESNLLGHFGRFVVVERPRLVEHTWMSENTLGIETSVSITFEPRAGGTQMTIVHRGVPDDERGRKHESGWTYLLTRLERELEKRRSS